MLISKSNRVTFRDYNQSKEPIQSKTNLNKSQSSSSSWIIHMICIQLVTIHVILRPHKDLVKISASLSLEDIFNDPKRIFSQDWERGIIRKLTGLEK